MIFLSRAFVFHYIACCVIQLLICIAIIFSFALFYNLNNIPYTRICPILRTMMILKSLYTLLFTNSLLYLFCCKIADVSYQNLFHQIAPLFQHGLQETLQKIRSRYYTNAGWLHPQR